MTTIKTLIASLIIASGLSAGACYAEPLAPMSDKERIDNLVRQNLMLIEENQKLKSARETPQTTQQAFAFCMQAAKGLGAMAAESVGGHCSKILKFQGEGSN